LGGSDSHLPSTHLTTTDAFEKSEQISEEKANFLEPWFEGGEPGKGYDSLRSRMKTALLADNVNK